MGDCFLEHHLPRSRFGGGTRREREEAGFELLWAPEHIVVPAEYESIYAASPTGRMDRLGRRGGIPDPIVWFAYVAARMTRLRFGTGVVILPEHNVVTFAKSCATLAVLSKGRFILGCGVGWNREEYEALGMPWDHRGARYDESSGRCGRCGGIRSRPTTACTSSSRPWSAIPNRRAAPSLSCSEGRHVPPVRRAGQPGDGYFPAIFPTERVHEELPKLVSLLRSSAEEAGRDPDSIEITSGGVRTAEEGVGTRTSASAASRWRFGPRPFPRSARSCCVSAKRSSPPRPSSRRVEKDGRRCRRY